MFRTYQLKLATQRTCRKPVIEPGTGSGECVTTTAQLHVAIISNIKFKQISIKKKLTISFHQ